MSDVSEYPLRPKIGVLRVLKITCAFILTAISLAASVPSSFPRQEEMYNRAQYEAAIESLKPFPSQPEALRITGKSFFMLGNFKKAVHFFEKLVTINPMSVVDFHWLGRAWARRAEISNPVSAPGYSAKARRSLERASELDPKNVAVLKDLLDQNLEAKNLDKAKSLAERIGALQAEEGRVARTRVIERSRELRTPEEQLRIWIDQIPRQLGRAVDLTRSAGSL